MTGSIWNMKRRTIDSGKSRRPIGIKKTKISDGVYSSTLLYVKFLIVWALVMVADFIVEFRFEYLWPLWLLFRSAFDSFRYQGMMFCVLFCCVSIASDVICYIFMPVQWLYVVASTYVWVQYVWHTDRGVCLPTVSLWVLFVYIETSLRLRDFKCLPFHLDLCRPFAAHCIGYPVVTLGFGCKSYVSYKLRLRKQKEVQKENELYFQLLQQALPAEQLNNTQQQEQLNGKILNGKTDETNFVQLSNTSLLSSTNTNDYTNKKLSIFGNNNDCNSNASMGTTTTTTNTNTCSSSLSSSSSTTTTNINGVIPTNVASHHKEINKISEHNFIAPTCHLSTNNNITTTTLLDGGDYADAGMVCNRIGSSNSMNDFKDDSSNSESNIKVQKLLTRNSMQLSLNMKDSGTSSTGGKKFKQNSLYRDDHVLSKLEQDVRKAKAELQSSRNVEQELRGQINVLLTSEKSIKSEITQLKQDNENLQIKLQNLATSRQQDKQSLVAMEKKLQEERKLKMNVEQQLHEEKKKKLENEMNKQQEQADMQINHHKEECLDTCNSKRVEMENELKQVNWEMKKRDEQISRLEHEIQILRQYKDAQNDTEVLMSALLAMQEKNSHLENNLSAETRLKMDLFSALGDAKRQIEIQHSILLQKDAEINELQTKVAEVMALVPSTSGFGALCHGTQPHFSAAFTSPNYIGSDAVLTKSNLNPNASDYQPKASM